MFVSLLTLSWYHKVSLWSENVFFFLINWLCMNQAEGIKSGDFRLGCMQATRTENNFVHKSRHANDRTRHIGRVQPCPQTHPISWRPAHEQGCGMSVCLYKLRLQTGMKQVHPNWECLTRKRLNQLVNHRVLPSPLLGPYSTTSTDTSPPLPPPPPPCEISCKESICGV